MKTKVKDAPVESDDENASSRKRGKAFLSAVSHFSAACINAAHNCLCQDTIVDSDDMAPAPVASTSKSNLPAKDPPQKPVSKKAEKPISTVKPERTVEEQAKSESEMSVLEDDSPKKKPKQKGKSKVSPPLKPKKTSLISSYPRNQMHAALLFILRPL